MSAGSALLNVLCASAFVLLLLSIVEALSSWRATLVQQERLRSSGVVLASISARVSPVVPAAFGAGAAVVALASDRLYLVSGLMLVFIGTLFTLFIVAVLQHEQTRSIGCGCHGPRGLPATGWSLLPPILLVAAGVARVLITHTDGGLWPTASAMMVGSNLALGTLIVVSSWSAVALRRAH